MVDYIQTQRPAFGSLDLIEEVRQRPGLWDPEQPADRVDKLKLWKEIGAALFRDWDTINKATAYDRVLQLQKKWRSLKDAYNRELRFRRRGGRQHRRVYVYYKDLQFLGGYEGLPEPETKTEELDFDDTNTDYHDNDHDCDTATLGTTHDDHDVSNHEDPLIQKIVKKKRRGMKRRASKYRDFEHGAEPVEIPMFINEITEENDSDKQFMISFVPELRKLPANIKMWARAQIANIMQEAVSAHFNNTLPAHPANSSRLDIKNPMHSSSE